MHKFVRDLITEWRKLSLPFANETVVVAVSGGADSLSLLLALDDLRTRHKLKLRLVAAHFNHKLRAAESDADEEFVKHLTAEKGFELAVGTGRTATEGNLEQNAREARYSFLASTAENLKAYGVLTAHTMNDQAETFLLNLIRGSGMDGLSAMKPIRDLRDPTTSLKGSPAIEEGNLDFPAFPLLPFTSTPLLIRPLLTWARRADTENFCRECGIAYRYDTMNEDMSFKRVRVRKILLPALADFNPKIIETLARTASLISQEPVRPSSAGRTAQDKLPVATLSELPIKDLKTLSKTELYETLRGWLRTRRGNLRSVNLKHIEAIERLIFSPKSGRMIELPDSFIVRRQGGRLIFGNIGNIKVDK